MAGDRERVTLVEVGLRDGLQNEPVPVPTERKEELFRKMVRSGLTHLQVTSFVRPDRVPQMADADLFAARVVGTPGLALSALVPNRRGYDRAVAAGFRRADVVLSASETFNQKNLNRDVAASLRDLGEIARAARDDAVDLRVDISTSFHCPFEGPMPAARVLELAAAVRDLGVTTVAFDDTDGMAFPSQVRDLVERAAEERGIKATGVVLHLHDTYGRALANAQAGLEAGVRTFDSSAGGLGGCPFSPGASGNVATEDLAALLEGEGFATGVKMERLLDAAETAAGWSARPYQGHLLRAMRPRALEVPPGGAP